VPCLPYPRYATGLLWTWSVINVVCNELVCYELVCYEHGLLWTWSVMNMICYELVCYERGLLLMGLLWTGLLWTWSVLNGLLWAGLFWTLTVGNIRWAKFLQIVKKTQKTMSSSASLSINYTRRSAEGKDQLWCPDVKAHAGDDDELKLFLRTLRKISLAAWRWRHM